MKLGLILVDIQNDYFKGGKNELVNSEQAAIRAKKVLTFFRQHGWPVFHVRHVNIRPDGNGEKSQFWQNRFNVHIWQHLMGRLQMFRRRMSG